MKQKRISFDIPEDVHTFLKVNCAKSHIALRDWMKKITLENVEELRKQELHSMLTEAFHRSYEGKGHKLTNEDLDRWEKMIDES